MHVSDIIWYVNNTTYSLMKLVSSGYFTCLHSLIKCNDYILKKYLNHINEIALPFDIVFHEM